LWWPSLSKDMQEQILCWSDMIDTEDTTSRSNEEEHNYVDTEI